MSWLSWLWPGRGTGKASARPNQPVTEQTRVEPVGDVLPVAAPPEPVATPDTCATLPWLLGTAALTDAAISPDESQALEAIGKTLGLPEIPDNLLPRAAALIPQLIALVRQTGLPTSAMAQRIGKDAVLAAEVMRLASSPYYRVQGDVTDLEQAISLIGLQGLQTVIARVLLKPIYRAAPGALSGRAGPRMWDHSEAMARHTAILSGPAGQSVFDGYLAGMLHDTGWTAAFTIIDRAGLTLPQTPSLLFGAALAEQVHRLFGLAAQRWEITPGFTALALDARSNGLAAGTHPLARILQQAEQLSLDELAPDLPAKVLPLPA
jgi:hypothetical protein